MPEPTVHQRDGWAWINRCPRCDAETKREDDYDWFCDNGHWCDMPNQEIVGRPDKPYLAENRGTHGGC